MSNTVAMDFGRAIFGPIGGTLFALVVAFSCFGAVNGQYLLAVNATSVAHHFHISGAYFTTSRLIYAASREGYLPAVFGRLHPTRKTPMNAALLQTAITTTFILVGGGFRALINFSVVASWGFYFLTVSEIGYLSKEVPQLIHDRSLGWLFSESRSRCWKGS